MGIKQLPTFTSLNNWWVYVPDFWLEPSTVMSLMLQVLTFSEWFLFKPSSFLDICWMKHQRLRYGEVTTSATFGELYSMRMHVWFIGNSNPKEFMVTWDLSFFKVFWFTCPSPWCPSPFLRTCRYRCWDGWQGLQTRSQPDSRRRFVGRWLHVLRSANLKKKCGFGMIWIVALFHKTSLKMLGHLKMGFYSKPMQFCYYLCWDRPWKFSRKVRSSFQGRHWDGLPAYDGCLFGRKKKNGREKAKVEKRIYGIHKNPTPWVRFLTKLRNSGFVIPWCLNLRLSPHHRKSFNGLSMVTYNYGPRVKHRC